MSEAPRKPGFFSRLFTGAKNLFRKIFPVAKSVLSVVDPDYGKLKNLAGNILTGSRGARLSKGLSRASDLSTKIGISGHDLINRRLHVMNGVRPEWGGENPRGAVGEPRVEVAPRG